MSARHMLLSPEQSRAARGWLGWSQGVLAEKSGVGKRVVSGFENGESVSADSRLLMRATFERAGNIRFESDGGIVMRPDSGGADGGR